VFVGECDSFVLILFCYQGRSIVGKVFLLDVRMRQGLRSVRCDGEEDAGSHDLVLGFGFFFFQIILLLPPSHFIGAILIK
jgi:hypothetical protein